MNRKQFVELLATRLGTTNTLANDILGVVINSIEECLLDGTDLNLKGFGKFFLTKRDSKKGYDMHRKIQLLVPGYTAVNFKASLNLRKAVKNKFKS